METPILETLGFVFILSLAASVTGTVLAWAGIGSPFRYWIKPKLRNIHPFLELILTCPFCIGFHVIEFFLFFGGYKPHVLPNPFMNWLLIWLACSSASGMMLIMFSKMFLAIRAKNEGHYELWEKWIEEGVIGHQ